MNDQPNNAGWKLRNYFDQVFAPAKIAKGLLNRRTVRYYRNELNRFLKFAGDDVRCVDCDEAILSSYGAWLTNQGYSEHTIRRNSIALRSLLRYWNPDAFPDMRGSYRAAGHFINADIEGTLEQVFHEHYLPERTSISSAGTVRQYGRCLSLFGVFLGRPAVLTDLTDKCVGKFLRWLVEVGGVKPITANAYVKQVKALWVWCAKKRIVTEFPTVQKLKQADSVPIAWTRTELGQLMRACRNARGRIGRIPASYFWAAFHLVLWDTGERTGAMLDLRWEMLDMETGHLTVPGEFRKGRQKAMIYPLKPATMKALGRILKPERELIFELSRSVDTFYIYYRKLIRDSGLEYVKRKTGPQKMRRSFASHLEAAGGNATRALKHTDRRCTDESYLDVRITETHHENEKLFPLRGESA